MKESLEAWFQAFMLAFELCCEPASCIESPASEVVEGSLEAWFQAFMLTFELCCEPAGSTESPVNEQLEAELGSLVSSFHAGGAGKERLIKRGVQSAERP